MSRIITLFPEKNYKRIVAEIGRFRYYIYEEEERLPEGIFSRPLALQDYNCVVAGSGDTATSYTLSAYPNVIIPKGEQIVVVRLLRYDDSHGDPHYNADDQLIFPGQDGCIYRLPRKNAPDHYLGITATANITSVADAYKLPEDNYGPINKYSEKGASLHIEFLPPPE